MVSQIESSNSTLYTNTLKSKPQTPAPLKQEQSDDNTQTSPELTLSTDSLKLSAANNNETTQQPTITTTQDAQQLVEQLKIQFNQYPASAQYSQNVAAQLVTSLLTNTNYHSASNG